MYGCHCAPSFNPRRSPRQLSDAEKDSINTVWMRQFFFLSHVICFHIFHEPRRGGRSAEQKESYAKRKITIKGVRIPAADKSIGTRRQWWWRWWIHYIFSHFKHFRGSILQGGRVEARKLLPSHHQRRRSSNFVISETHHCHVNIKICIASS